MKSIEVMKAQQERELNRLLKWVGSQAQLSKQLGVSRQVVHLWFKRGRISATMATEVERKTLGLFKRDELRPDVIEWSYDV